MSSPSFRFHGTLLAWAVFSLTDVLSKDHLMCVSIVSTKLLVNNQYESEKGFVQKTYHTEKQKLHCTVLMLFDLFSRGFFFFFLNADFMSERNIIHVLSLHFTFIRVVKSCYAEKQQHIRTTSETELCSNAMKSVFCTSLRKSNAVYVLYIISFSSWSYISSIHQKGKQRLQLLRNYYIHGTRLTSLTHCVTLVIVAFIR